jgi:hypothetical protein
MGELQGVRERSSNVVGRRPTYRCVELKITGKGSPRVGAKRL